MTKAQAFLELWSMESLEGERWYARRRELRAILNEKP